MKFDNLGDWCKWLEKNFSNEIMIPTIPTIIRLDGNNFHSWTKGLERPFDDRLINLMTETTKFLVKETNAIIGYTQSDEITLILYNEKKESSIYHDGKKQKILSKLTAKCVNFFNEKRKELLPNHDKIAVFDARIYQTPSLNDATLQLLWRENDATKNSISMMARSLFSHKQLINLNGNEMQNKMLLEKNKNWNDLSDIKKRGVYVKRILIQKNLTVEERDSLPPQHDARLNPNLLIERSVIKTMNYPPFNKISNKVDVVFYDDKPKMYN